VVVSTCDRAAALDHRLEFFAKLHETLAYRASSVDCTFTGGIFR
jgi:hypothetical protein